MRHSLGRWSRRVTLLLTLAWIAPDCGSPENNIVVASQSVGPAGGTVSVTDVTSPAFGTQVVIPAGALGSATTITITQVASSSLGASVMEFDFGPTGTTFTQPVTVTVKYTQQYLTSIGLADPTLLRVIEMSPGVATEDLATLSQDTVNKTITAQTLHFSSFAAVGYTNATLSGAYFLETYYFQQGTTQPLEQGAGGNALAPLGFTSASGVATFNGVGGWSITGTVDTDGITTSSSFSSTYSVAADGTLTVALQPGATATGSVLAGGSVVCFASTAGNTPQFYVGIKKGGSFTNASLSGSYFLEAYYFQQATTQPLENTVGNPAPAPLGFTSASGVATFNGVGGWSTVGTVDTDGTSASSPFSSTYSVAADGTLTVALQPGATATGGVLAGGSILIFASTAGTTPQFYVGIKKGGSFTNASLSGSYSLEARYFQQTTTQPLEQGAGGNAPAPLGFTTGSGVATFDGVGGWSTVGTVDTDGISASSPFSNTYSVAADGTLTVALQPGATATGGALAGGSVAIFASTAGTTPQIYIALRR